jgi:hypothetical protein
MKYLLLLPLIVQAPRQPRSERIGHPPSERNLIMTYLCLSVFICGPFTFFISLLAAVFSCCFVIKVVHADRRAPAARFGARQ